LPLAQAFDEVDRATTITCVILTGTGEGFCFGADTRDTMPPPSPPLGDVVPSEIGKKIDEGQPATLWAWHRAHLRVARRLSGATASRACSSDAVLPR
jgi:enoyl-CoA hydratase/carnithine racemase